MGRRLGSTVGLYVGLSDGLKVGKTDGGNDGMKVGVDELGKCVGMKVGIKVGFHDGINVGDVGITVVVNDGLGVVQFALKITSTPNCEPKDDEEGKALDELTMYRPLVARRG